MENRFGNHRTELFLKIFSAARKHPSAGSSLRMKSSSLSSKEDRRMRSKIWILLLCIQAFGFTAPAQNPAKRQLVLQLANGGFVAFRSEIPGNSSTRSLASSLYAQAFAGEDRILHP